MPQKDPEARRLYQIAYFAEHREENRQRCAAHYAAHKEERRASDAAYYLGHREEAIARMAVYQAAHRAEANVRNAKYQATHLERHSVQQARRRAAKINAPLNDFTAAQWSEMQEAVDHRCLYCGRRAKGHLTQDHLTPLSKGGSHTLSNIVPACRSCNCRKQAGPVPVPVQPMLLALAPSQKRKK